MNSSTRTRGAARALAIAVAASAAFAAQASGHARIYPSTVAKGEGQAYTLVVPNESDSASITEVSLEVPEGLLLGGLVTEGGWQFETEATGDGHSAVTSKVTWSGGKAPVGEAAYFRFTARPDEEHEGDPTSYTFKVTETYDDGNVSEWTGPEDSDEPAPVVKVVDVSSGGGDTVAAAPAEASEEDGGDGGSTTATIALIVAALALLLSLAGLARRGGRTLT